VHAAGARDLLISTANVAKGHTLEMHHIRYFLASEPLKQKADRHATISVASRFGGEHFERDFCPGWRRRAFGKPKVARAVRRAIR
jgi:hypothetical protein